MLFPISLSLRDPSPLPPFPIFPSLQFSHSFLSLPNLPLLFSPTFSLLSQSASSLPFLFSFSLLHIPSLPPTPAAGRAAQFPPVQWIFVWWLFWRGRHSLPAQGECAPWSRASQRRSFQSLRVDFDPCQPPPVHLQGRGRLPACTVSARVVPHPASWFAARSGCFPGVLCPAGTAAAELFVLIVQSIGAQSGFVFDLHSCAAASTLDRKENELIRPVQLCSSPK